MILGAVWGFGALVGAAVVKVIADDAREWAPCLARQLVLRAIDNLSKPLQDRYAEEWLSHVHETPGA